MPIEITDLPTAAGSYVLEFELTVPLTLRPGRLGTVRLGPGRVRYYGSARGPGGLRARVGRHLRPVKRPHWHVDALTARQPVTRVLIDRQRSEHNLVRADLDGGRYEVTIPGFGSSDCGSCPAHLLVERRSDDARSRHARRPPRHVARFETVAEDVDGEADVGHLVADLGAGRAGDLTEAGVACRSRRSAPCRFRRPVETDRAARRGSRDRRGRFADKVNEASEKVPSETASSSTALEPPVSGRSGSTLTRPLAVVGVAGRVRRIVLDARDRRALGHPGRHARDRDFGIRVVHQPRAAGAQHGVA